MTGANVPRIPSAPPREVENFFEILLCTCSKHDRATTQKAIPCWYLFIVCCTVPPLVSLCPGILESSADEFKKGSKQVRKKHQWAYWRVSGS